MRALVDDLVRAPRIPGDGLRERARLLLFEEIVAALPDDTAAGAALMGVSEATFRRWRRALPRRP